MTANRLLFSAKNSGAAMQIPSLQSKNHLSFIRMSILASSYCVTTDTIYGKNGHVQSDIHVNDRCILTTDSDSTWLIY